MSWQGSPARPRTARHDAGRAPRPGPGRHGMTPACHRQGSPARPRTGAPAPSGGGTVGWGALPGRPARAEPGGSGRAGPSSTSSTHLDPGRRISVWSGSSRPRSTHLGVVRVISTQFDASRCGQGHLDPVRRISVWSGSSRPSSTHLGVVGRGSRRRTWHGWSLDRPEPQPHRSMRLSLADLSSRVTRVTCVPLENGSK